MNYGIKDFLFKPRTKYCDECQKEKEIDSRKSTTTEQLVENYRGTENISEEAGGRKIICIVQIVNIV